MPDRSCPRALDTSHHRVRPDGEVLPGTCPGEVRDRSAHPHAVADVARCRSDSDRARPIVVLDILMTRRDRALEERRLATVHLARWVTADRDRALRTVPLIAEVLVTLEATEVVEDVGEAPAGIARRRPLVVVLRSATQREARVRGRAPAHDPSSRQRDPPVELGVGGVAPVVVDCRLRPRRRRRVARCARRGDRGRPPRAPPCDRRPRSVGRRARNRRNLHRQRRHRTPSIDCTAW